MTGNKLITSYCQSQGQAIEAKFISHLILVVIYINFDSVLHGCLDVSVNTPLCKINRL